MQKGSNSEYLKIYSLVEWLEDTESGRLSIQEQFPGPHGGNGPPGALLPREAATPPQL